MNNSAYLTVDIYACLAAGHRFEIIGSDKTPMKRSLTCATCTNRTPGKTVMVAHGIDTLSWGEWRRQKREEV